MTNTQLLILLCSIAAMLAGQTTLLVLYINAKIDGTIGPLQKQMDFVVRYIVEHSERIAALEARNKPAA